MWVISRGAKARVEGIDSSRLENRALHRQGEIWRENASWDFHDVYCRRLKPPNRPVRRPAVKVYLTDGQLMRLFHFGGRCNLASVESNQSMENAHDKRNSHYSDRPGTAGRWCYHRFGSGFTDCDGGWVNGEAGFQTSTRRHGRRD